MANITCTLCESAVALIGAEANLTNATVATISHAVMALCAIVGGRIVASECDFIVGNIDNIVAWVDKGMNHSAICQRLHLCLKSASKK